MVYDVRGHLPQIIEEMRQDFKQGNIEGLETNRMFLEKIVPNIDTVFKTQEQERDRRTFDEWKQYLTTVTKLINSPQSKKLDDFNDNVTMAQNHRNKAVSKHEKDYWETIISIIIRHNNKEYQQLLKEQPTPTLD